MKNPKKVIRRRCDLFSLNCSKLFFNNASGLRGNLKAMFTNMTIKKNSLDNKIHVDGQVNDLATKGHVKLEHLYDPQLIRVIENKFDKLIDNKKNFQIIAKENDQIFCKKMLDPINKIPETKNLINDKVIKFLESYFKTNFKATRFLIWRNYHIPLDLQKKHEMYSNWWHCDPENATWVKLFVTLTDVTEKNGPFHVVTKSRTKELIKMGFGHRGNYKLPTQVMEDPKYVWKATGRPGTAFACTCTLGFHRAGVPESGHHRDILQILFSPSNKPMKENWHEDLEKSDYFV